MLQNMYTIQQAISCLNIVFWLDLLESPSLSLYARTQYIKLKG